MTWFVLKAALSGLIIATIAEIGRRNAAAAALVASLPLVSIIGMIWIWRETRDVGRIATHAQATFWYVLPSLPMFLVMPMLIRSGIGFWVSLFAGSALTVVLYLGMIWLAPRLGIEL
ncbi:MAG: DUF3147 family protein [Rhodobacter sp.]|nr:DUF3147 family protein [Rhodobacter sp.]